MKKSSISIVLLFFLLSAMVVATATDGVAASDPEVFEYHNGRMNIKGQRLAVLSLLERIAEAANAEIFVFDPLSDLPIDADYQSMSPGDIIRSVLKECSHAVVYAGTQGSQLISGVHVMVGSRYARLKKPPNATSQTNVSRNRSPSASQAANTFVPNQSNRRRPSAKGASSRITRPSGHNNLSRKNTTAAIPQDPFTADRYPDDQSIDNSGIDFNTAELSTVDNESVSLTGPVGKEAALINEIRRLEERIASGESDKHYYQWTEVFGNKHVVHDQVYLDHYLKELNNLRSGG
jgi:hypothetical protein